MEGKRALVTGGATGIGRAVSVRFAEEGADVAIYEFHPAGGCPREAEVEVQAACQEVREQGRQDLLVQADCGGLTLYPQFIEDWTSDG